MRKGQNGIASFSTQKDNTIDIAVCYHKKAMIFESDAVTPMQLGRAVADINLDMRGDDTGNNISSRNRFYSEDTALWWLWKNSNATIKGCMHYRRLLDLNNPGKSDYDVVLEDIQEPQKFIVKKLGLDSKNIKTMLKSADILTANGIDVSKWSAPTVAEQFKATHIPYHWDIAMDIVRRDFPEIYPTALRISNGKIGHFHNLVIMKADLFDAMCEFCFHITETMSKMIDETRPEFNDNWRFTARYLSFVWERMCGIYLEYLVWRGHKLMEFPAVSIAPRGTNIENLQNYTADAYAMTEKVNPIKPAFKDKNAVAIMMSTNDNYAPYCAVMLQSIISNAAPNRNYDIVIAASHMSESNQNIIKSMATDHISVRLIDVRKYMTDVDLSIFKTNAHFSVETYYRFFIPEIFANYNKVLYLDVDMVANRDVAELYDTDIGDNWWGVTNDKCISTLCSMPQTWGTKELAPYIKNVLRMDCLYDYFQAGVMIWNIRQCRADNVMDKCLNRLKEIKTPMYVDQCVMNSVANGKHIFWLSPYWNVAWNPKFNWTDCRGSEPYNTAVWWTSRAYILHYCSGVKPWNEPWRENAHYFWKYARQTMFYEKLLMDITQTMPVYNRPSNVENEIRRIKRKIRKYKTLQGLTIGLVKTVRKRKAQYRQRLWELQDINKI